MHKKARKGVGQNKNFGPIQKLTVPDFQHITNVYEQMQQDNLDKPAKARKQMKPFTIRKAAQPSRAGAHTGLAAADTSVDVSMNKYNTTGADRGNSVNYGPLSTAKDDAPHQIDPDDETLLEQADLDKLAEDFPGKTPENPWIKEQTNKQYLTAIKGLPARHVNVYQAHKHVKNEQKFGNDDNRNVNPDQQSIEAKAILDREYDIFQDPMAPPEKALTRYDTWDQDRTIEQWIRYCEMRPDQPHAISPCFADNEYAWKPVRVVGYDYQTNKYKVEVCNTRQIKYVTRLSLLFYAEDPGQFRERVNLCKTRLKNCAAEAAFTKEVDKVKHEAVSTLSKERRESFMRKCIQESDRFEQNAIYRTFSDLMRVVQEEYIRQMKKCIVMQEMHNPENFAKFIASKVPIRLNKYTYPYFGVVASKKYSYMKYKTRIFNAHWCSDADVADLTSIFSKKSLEFMQKRYMNTQRDSLRLPLQLPEMTKEQTSHCDSIAKNMQIQWREFLVSEIRRKLRETHNIFESDIDKYDESRLKGIIQRFELILNNFMREFSDMSIKDWVAFIKSFTVPKTDKKELWDLSREALLTVKLEILKPVTSKDTKKKPKPVKKNDDDPDAEDGAAEEDDSGKRIRYKPNLKECEDFVLGCLEQMRKTTNEFLCLEKDLVTFLNLPDKSSFELNSDFPWLQEARAEIQAIFKENQMAPHALLEEYKKYEYILNVDKKRLIKDLFNRPVTEENPSEKASYAEIAAKLNQFHSAEYEILNISNDIVDFPIFQVKAQDLKQRLAKEAKAIKERLSERVYRWCSDSVKHISTTYDNMQKKISRVPENEEELVELREFIKRSKEHTQGEMLDLQKQVESHYELLDEFSYMYNVDDIQNCWTLKQYPMIIGEAIADGNSAIMTQEEQFIAKLDAEKEQFLKDLASYKESFKHVQSFCDIEALNEFFREVSQLNSSIEKSITQVETFNMREGRLNQATSAYPDFDELRVNFDPFHQLITTMYEANRALEEFSSTPLLAAPFAYEDVESQVITWQKTLFKLAKNLNTDYPDASDAATDFKKKVDEFSLNLPLMKCVMSEALHDEDWLEIKKAIDNLDLDTQTITVKRFAQDKLALKIIEIEEITNRAEKKFLLSKKLKVMKEEMKDFKLTTVPYKSETFVLKAYDEVNAKLDDQMVQTQAMLGSSNCVLKLRTDTRNWENKLTLMQDIIIEINKCQKQWMYLEPIFSSEDIGKTLGAELAAFIDVDKLWKGTMEGIEAEPGIYDLAERDSIQTWFIEANKKLEKILRSLNEYLEEKRLVFPRFYFLANEDLLMILAQTKDPTLVQKHMDKCFEGIQKVNFSDKQEVTAMISAEQEVVELCRKIDVNEGDKKGNVEKWMLEIERVMRQSLKLLTLNSIQDYYNNDRTKWVAKWPGQIVLAVDQIDWTKGVEEVFDDMREGKMEAYRDTINSQIMEVVNMVRGQLSAQLRTTLKALVVLDVHGRSVVEDLIDKQTQTAADFEWGSQLRYYWTQVKKDYNLEVKMVTAAIDYGFEYLGNSPRLVITPLTDRCYRTLMGAKNLDYGGAPEGPAGTGKTESVKDLAKALAVQCVVFNCSDGLDHNSMGKFFKGLASSGAWCCFDEFNRIDLEVLSVVAQQILQIQRAIKAKKSHFDFEDTPNLVLNCACAVNITMNPGYAGRSELPDNLKALFRPCAMMVPDYALIAAIELYSFGFSDAKQIAVKVCASLTLSSEQLSSQAHYDFGMRALKAILTACGNLRRALDWSEDQIGLRALKDVNLPKFTSNDIPLYTGITNDLFPGVDLPPPDYEKLNESMYLACEKMNLVPKAQFLKKCIQLYETIMVRHGLMVVGGAYSGKSKVIKTLQDAFTMINNDDFKPVETHYINPKSILQTQLYGYNDEDSGEWTDGVLAIKISMCANSDTTDRKWIIFDGPVDAVWIENMNTVLDDNKKLCLSSGAIIKLKPTMTIMFEVEDLSEASPATVSRCGMVLLEPHELGHNVLITSFIKDIGTFLDEKLIAKIEQLMHYMADVTVEFIYKNCKFPVPTGPNFVVDNMIKVFDTFVRDWKPTEEDQPCKIPANCEDVCLNALVFAFTWGIGGQIDEDTRNKYDLFLQDIVLGENVVEKNQLVDIQEKYPEPIKFKTVIGTEYTSLFDMSFNPEETKWINWVKTQAPYEIPIGGTFSKVIVPTIDSIRTNSVLLRLLINKKHTLLCGSTGTGKSISIINQLNESFQNEDWTFLSLAFSAQTSANQTQNIIDGSMDRRRKGVWGPKLGKNGILFVDDLNMPKKEIYGAQPPIELLRQWMDYEGWYELDGEKEFRKTVGITFCAAMQPPGGQKTITNRYVRHYNIVYVEPYSDNSLKTIFGSIMEWNFQSQQKFTYGAGVKSTKDNVVAATIETYQEIQKRFRPTPAKSHYTYNLRDVSKVFQGISKSDPRAIEEDVSMIKLWAHECMRVFQDRLISQDDRDKFGELLKEKTKEKFKKSFDDLVTVKPLLFGSFSPQIYPDGDTSKKPLTDIYCELLERTTVKKNCESQLEEFNTMNRSKAMDLVLFTDAIEHIVKIHRVITTQFGNALLVGVGGSGRKSLSELATFIAQYDMVQLEIIKGYGMKDWREDMVNNLFGAAGIDSQPQVFLMADTQIINEAFVEDINNILNNGMIPNLYGAEDVQKIVEDMKDAHKADDLIKGMEDGEIMGVFEDCARNSIHVVLAFSPIGDDFKRRLRMFPALVNCCTIDWFLPWPAEALQSVADQFLSKVDDLPMKDGIVAICVDMQERVLQLTQRYLFELRRYYYVTPTSYLILIKTFTTLLEEKRMSNGGDIAKYERGLKQMQKAGDQAEDIKTKLIELIPQLKKQAEEAVVTQRVVEAKKVEVDAEVVEVNKEAAAAGIESDKASAIEADCNEALQQVMPIYYKAVAAVDKLNPGDVTEMARIVTASEGLKIVAQSLCYFFIEGGLNEKKYLLKKQTAKDPDVYEYWVPCKKDVLAKGKTLQWMKDFDKDNVDPSLVEKMTPLIQQDAYKDSALKNAGKAAIGIGSWCKAIIEYDNAMKIVKPKQAELKVAKATSAAANKVKEEAEARLAAKEAELKECVDKLDAVQREEKRLRDEHDNMKAKKELAELLINSLKGERESWTKSLEKGKADRLTLEGDILVASGIMAYLGVFIKSYREECVSQWVKMLGDYNIQASETVNLTQVLGEQVKIVNWTSNGLPSDEFSIENGIIMDYSDRWCLCVDPQMQANKWLKGQYKAQKEDDPNVEVVKPTMSTSILARKLEACITMGTPVIYEDATEHFDPMLDPLLSKQIEKKSSETLIKFGDKMINFNTDFKFFITTKMPAPHYSPEVCVKVTILNFMVTQEGLQDQMLNEIIRIEEKAKYDQRIKCIQQKSDNARKKKDVDDQILLLLANSKEDILEDTELRESLAESKEKQAQIEQQDAEAESIMKGVERIRAENIPVGLRVSRLFFVLTDLTNVDPMYQYSLDFFKHIFAMTLNSAAEAGVDKSKKEEKRNYWINEFTKRLYSNVSRSLFQRHILLFSFLLCLKIMDENLLEEGGLNIAELRFLMAGATQVEMTKPNPTGEGGWLLDKSWLTILEMSSRFESFKGFDDSFVKNLKHWEKIYNSSNPQSFKANPWPEPWGSDVSLLLKKTIIMRAIRPDKVIPMIQKIVKKQPELGKEYLTPPQSDLAALYADSKNNSAIIIVISPGADPMSEIDAFSAQKKIAVKSLSLGRGQAKKAVDAIREAQTIPAKAGTMGTWVVLQNCHLAPSFMPQLDALIEEIKYDETGTVSFRIWMTTEPSDKFPVTIVQNGTKMTSEPPKGIQQNITKSYRSISEREFENCQKPLPFRRLLWGLCFFNAVILERRKFGPLGWNKAYEFSASDLSISMKQLTQFLDFYDEIPFTALIYMVAEANYGGRVTDPQDRRCIMTLLMDYYNQDMINEDNHKLSPSGTYYVPSDGARQDYIDFIKDNIPLNDLTEVFGLHDNADITSAINATDVILGTALSLQPRATSSSGKTQDEVLAETCQGIIEKLPPQLDYEGAQRKHPVMYEESMNTVLHQEILRFNNLLKIISGSLKNIQLAIKGEVVMSSELESVGNALFDNRIPATWSKRSYPSLKPLASYIVDFVERLAFISKWIQEGKPPNFWVSGFFFTQSFLTGLKQNFARKYTIAIDQIDWDYEVQDENKFDKSKEAPDGAYIYGLFIEGCRWDNEQGTLEESNPKILFTKMPYIWMKPDKKVDIVEKHSYTCPVYKTLERFGTLSTTGHSTNFVTMIELPMMRRQTEAHWVKRGVAMITQLND